jgi:hypothetical protein
MELWSTPAPPCTVARSYFYFFSQNKLGASGITIFDFTCSLYQGASHKISMLVATCGLCIAVGI